LCAGSYDTVNLTTIPAEAKTMFAIAREHNNSVSLFKPEIRCTDVYCTLIHALTTEVMHTYLITYSCTIVPPYLLIQYLWFRLSMVYHGQKKNWKIKEINCS
jgi:hypothetical protein